MKSNQYSLFKATKQNINKKVIKLLSFENKIFIKFFIIATPFFLRLN